MMFNNHFSILENILVFWLSAWESLQLVKVSRNMPESIGE